MKYRSEENRSRARRGRAMIELHPDLGRMMDDPITELRTAASDVVADILHALNAETALDGTPEAFLRHALESYFGDFEDEPDPVAIKRERVTQDSPFYENGVVYTRETTWEREA